MTVELNFGLLESRTTERTLKSLEIKVRKVKPDEWLVSRQNGKSYSVVLFNGKFSCGCPDHAFRKHECKHILAVRNTVSYGG